MCRDVGMDLRILLAAIVCQRETYKSTNQTFRHRRYLLYFVMLSGTSLDFSWAKANVCNKSHLPVTFILIFMESWKWFLYPYSSSSKYMTTILTFVFHLKNMQHSQYRSLPLHFNNELLAKLASAETTFFYVFFAEFNSSKWYHMDWYHNNIDSEVKECGVFYSISILYLLLVFQSLLTEPSNLFCFIHCFACHWTQHSSASMLCLSLVIAALTLTEVSNITLSGYSLDPRGFVQTYQSFSIGL